MKRKKKKSKPTFTKSISDTPMTQEEWDACEDLLVEMVARAIFAEHQELKDKEKEMEKEEQVNDKQMETNS